MPGIWQSVVPVFGRIPHLRCILGHKEVISLLLLRNSLNVAPFNSLHVCYRGKPGSQSDEIGKISGLTQGGHGCLER